MAEAEVMFEAIRDQEPNDAGAWNGLGSVFAVREWYRESKKDKLNLMHALENYRKALRYIDIALEITKGNYPEAKQDKEMVMQAIKRVEAILGNE